MLHKMHLMVEKKEIFKLVKNFVVIFYWENFNKAGYAKDIKGQLIE